MTRPPSLLRAAARSVLLRVGVLFSLIGLLFLGIGVAWGLEEHAFATRGITVDATVVDRSIRKANFDDNPSTQYIVRYRFVPARDAPVVESRVVPVEEWERSSIGAIAKIRFLEGAGPRGVGESDWGGPITFSALGFLLLMVGGPIAFLGVREAVGMTRLRSGPTV
jgi:uncharacterized protein DUF3592